MVPVTADHHHRQPVGPRHVPLGPELEDQGADQADPAEAHGHDRADPVHQIVRCRLAHGGAQELDDPEHRRDLGDLDHPPGGESMAGERRPASRSSGAPVPGLGRRARATGRPVRRSPEYFRAAPSRRRQGGECVAPSRERDLSTYRSKRRAGRTPEPMPAEDQPPGRHRTRPPRRPPGAVVRHPGAPRQLPPLGLPAGAGRRAGVLGAPQGPPAGPGSQPPGCPDRGPSTRVRVVRGGHPGRRVRRRKGGHLGFGHLRQREVVRRRGHGPPPRARSGPGPLRPLPHRPEAVDDPSDGPPARRLDTTTGEGGADAVHPGLPAPGRRRVGLRVQMGRRAGRGRHRRRAHPAHDPQRQRHHQPHTPSWRRWPRTSARRPMVLDGEVVAYDGTKPSFSLLQQRMGVVDQVAGPPAVAGGTRDLPGLRCPVPRRHADRGASL